MRAVVFPDLAGVHRFGFCGVPSTVGLGLLLFPTRVWYRSGGGALSFRVLPVDRELALKASGRCVFFNTHAFRC